MAKGIFVFLCLVCLALNSVESNPIEEQVSYVERLNIQYENGSWTCGELKCPWRTFGCKIEIQSDPKINNALSQNYNCIGTIGVGNHTGLAKEQLVDITITSYVGAKTVFKIEYNDKGEEIADGIIPVEKLEELKEKFKELKRLVKEEKNAVAVLTQGSYPRKKIDHRYILRQEKLNFFKSKIAHVEGLNFQYKNGKWTCGDVKCPKEATGCNIRFKTDETDYGVLYQTFNCNGTISTGNKILLVKENIIDIDIRSYVGAESAFLIRYNDEDEEVVDGVVAVDQLDYLKDEFKKLKKGVLEEGRGTALLSVGSYRGKDD